MNKHNLSNNNLNHDEITLKNNKFNDISSRIEFIKILYQIYCN